MKYMGSKSRIKKYIVPILQKIIDEQGIQMYIEPFAGGCNIIDSIKCKHRVANDLSTPLIELWKAVQRGECIPLFTKEEYKGIRTNKEKYSPFMLGVAGFLHSYNGKWFSGYAGEIITKTGVHRDYRKESINNILKQSHNLQDVIFSNKSYHQMKKVKNSLIYCDIPYKDTTGYSNHFDHDAFYDWAREFSKENILLISELTMPDDFICIWQQDVLRTQNNRDRTLSTEKLFVHKDSYEKVKKLLDSI